MSLYNHFYHWLFRLKDIKDGTGIYSLLSQFKKEQYLSPGELRALQSERLRKLLRHAQKQSPYYRQLFSRKDLTFPDSFGVDDLPTVPLLTRTLLQQNVDAILCEDAHNPIPNSSGGSTGQPVNFYQDERYRITSHVTGLLFLSWMGIRPGDRTAIFWGADREFKDLSFYDKLMLTINRTKQLNSFSMTDERIEKFLEEINAYKPRYIYGYASSLYLVAKYINRTKPLTFAPVAVRSSAEMLFDFQREEIERAFQAPVYNFYGSREVNNIAAECAAHEGLHVFASTRIVEVVDESGRPVPDGTTGHVAITDLTNFSFPFIRYLTGDMATKKSSPCSCGRGYPLLEKIQGRSTDMIVVNGEYIHGEFFTHLFYGKPEIAQFQLIQEDEQTLRLLIVSSGEKPDLEDVLAAIRAKVGEHVTLQVEFTDHIPPTASGKHRFTISRLHEQR